ncbi:hypothetical protein C8F01DRAFT_1253484 [Mycena amicta]|nr:hypothetical protein C8F01DRAFT_1253484 [Mycena amicta]
MRFFPAKNTNNEDGEPYRLRLGESKLLFFPPQAALDASTVVQVIVKPLKRYPTRAEVAVFCDAQEDITAAVETIAFENLTSSSSNAFVQTPTKVEVKGDGYVLLGEKIKWVYGRELALKWGDEKLRMAEEKWVFYFRTGSFDEVEEW